MLLLEESALADKPRMLYITLPPSYMPISIIDCDNMYTLVFLPGFVHTINCFFLEHQVR